MPYEIKHDGDQWVVVNKDTGKVKGHTTSEAEAQKMIEAIYANEGEDRSIVPTYAEYRYWEATELRAEPSSDNEPNRIVGVIPYNSMSKDLGGFREVILPTAFANNLADQSREIWAFLDHNKKQPLGRRSVGSVRFRQTDQGLGVSIYPPDTTWGRDAMEAVRSGLAPGLSFGYNDRNVTWNRGDKVPVRQLHDIDWGEVSVVYNPAFQASTAALRSYEEYQRSLDTINKPELVDVELLLLRQKQIELGLHR